jgi:RNA polymerase sigma factor (sigma-70 family)
MPDERKWHDYFDRLTRLARKKLASLPVRVKDEEDIASSAIKSFLRGRQAATVSGDDFDLWPILATIAARKCVDLIVYSKAKKRDDARISDAELDAIACSQPGPASVAEQEESRRRLLDALNDDHSRHIAVWKMEGFTNREIADKLDCSERSVEREVKLIKGLWDQFVSRVWEEAGERAP